MKKYGSEDSAKRHLVEQFGEMADHPIVKMSKSLGNVVNPDDVVQEFGADTLRVYIMFLGDFEKAAPWQTSAVKGCKRFLDRVWNLAERCSDSMAHTPANEMTIAAMMSLVNDYYANGCTKGDLHTLLLLLSPFAPHMVEELWEQLGFAAQEGKMACEMAWPVFDENKMVEHEKEIAVQVNGKLRSAVKVPADCDDETVIAVACADEKVQKQMQGMTLVKSIVVKNKLVNLILKPEK